MKITRRSLVDRAVKGSLLALTFKVGGASLLLTPEQARAQDVPLQKLSPEQAKQLAILAEAMVPGSADLGVVHFVDHQLANDPDNAMLLAKYFGVRPPYLDFYAAGLAITNGVAQEKLGKSIEALDAAGLEQLIMAIAPPGTVIEGYPVFLFYMCLRSDAVDVTYGTPDGFAKLNIPYMQHILPPEDWNG